ncbi:MAG: hypothetical protein ACYSW8_21265 [Planctomycetota bacterium]|jgi:hypothetical protein
MADEIKKVYQAFDPSPLEAKETDLYVDLDAVRGGDEPVNKLAQTIKLSESTTTQLFAGHIGSGKSTELRLLQKQLEDDGYFVVFCQILQDIDERDADFPDVLLSMMRQMVSQIKERGKVHLKPGYFQQRFEELSGLLKSEVDLADLANSLLNVSSAIKSSPDTRKKIREIFEPKTNDWLSAANDIVGKAVLELDKKDYVGLVILVDDLDKVSVEKSDEQHTSVAERLFLNRHAQLTGFQCHIVYTLPLPLVYSCRERDIASLYKLDAPPVIPMTKVAGRDGRRYKKGFDRFVSIIQKRMDKANVTTPVFESNKVRDKIIKYSAGQPRQLMILIREAIIAGSVPIKEESIENIARKIRHSYERQLRQEHWAIIEQVRQDNRLERNADNESLCMELLANRAILYYLNEEQWYGLNPLLPEHKI